MGVAYGHVSGAGAVAMNTVGRVDEYEAIPGPVADAWSDPGCLLPLVLFIAVGIHLAQRSRNS
jgi:hypothetical protein